MEKNMAHTKWMCKYHVVFTPKYRRKIIYYELRRDIQQIIRDLCKWKGIEIIEGHNDAGPHTSIVVNTTEI